MKGYGFATWLKKEEYKNYFLTATHLKGEEGPSIRLNKLNYQEKNGHDVVARAATTNLCNCLSVGNYSGNMGLAAGGMDDGSVMIWDIDTLYKEGDTFGDEPQTSSLISAQLVHEKSVNAIEFNPNIPNLIASGGEEVFIQDIQHSTEEPNVFTPGEPNYHEGETITAISWNKTVPYILASAGNTGQIVVWDLKNSKAIFNLKDPNLVNYNYDLYSGSKREEVPTAEYQIIWSLKVPTQFLISNDYETMTMWDLRKPEIPIVSLSDIHSGGVLSCSWCPQDQNIIASSSNEGKTCFVHSETGDLISEIYDGKKYSSIEWSPYNRGLILGYNTDDETNVLNFSNATSKTETNDSSYAPKWLSRPIGARFGFGGRLITFCQNSEQPIKLYQTQTSPELCHRIVELEETKTTDEVYAIIDSFIEKNNKNEVERLEWITLKSLSTHNFDSLFSMLEIDKNSVINEAERFSGKKKSKRVSNADSNKRVSIKGGLDELDANQANAFFENLAETSDKRKEEEEKKTEAKPGCKVVQETISRNSNWDEGAEGIIKRNLLIGNVEGAAECAMKCGRTTEALLLALSSDSEAVFEDIKEQYFANTKDNFIKTIIKGISDNEVEELVLELAQSNWREALAYTLSYTEESKVTEYVEKIAEIVLKKRDVNSAIICYMISRNIDQLADLWKVRADSIIKKNPQYKYSIYANYAEKITLYRQITGIQTQNEHCNTVIEEFAEFLIGEGLNTVAHKYLDLNFCKSLESDKIRERAFYNRVSKMGSEFQKPKYTHNIHQLPRINPNVHHNQSATGHRGGKGYRQNIPQKDQHQFKKSPEVKSFNPNEMKTSQFTNPPPKTYNARNNDSKKAKICNFGYCPTDPVLISTAEDSKIDSVPKQHKTKTK